MSLKDAYPDLFNELDDKVRVANQGLSQIGLNPEINPIINGQLDRANESQDATRDRMLQGVGVPAQQMALQAPQMMATASNPDLQLALRRRSERTADSDNSRLKTKIAPEVQKQRAANLTAAQRSKEMQHEIKMQNYQRQLAWRTASDQISAQIMMSTFSGLGSMAGAAAGSINWGGTSTNPYSPPSQSKAISNGTASTGSGEMNTGGLA